MRQVVVEVDDVLGVRSLARDEVAPAQPLLEGAEPERVASLGRLDGELLRTLQAARLVADDTWAALAAAEAAA
jgi:chemotaxis signal transduction protein